MRQSQSTKPTKDPFFKGTNETDSDLRTTLNDPFFETGEADYKECTNPNDPDDKYQQFRFDFRRLTYFIDDDGYLVARLNKDYDHTTNGPK